MFLLFKKYVLLELKKQKTILNVAITQKKISFKNMRKEPPDCPVDSPRATLVSARVLCYLIVCNHLIGFILKVAIKTA